MKTKTHLLLNLIVILSLILTVWPAGIQAKTIAAAPSPAPLAHDEDQGWQTWQALPAAVKAKVDPRLLAELQGKITPAHRSLRPENAPTVSLHDAPEKTRFLVYLKVQADLQPLGQRTFSSRAARRRAVLNALLSTAQATQGPVKALLETRMSRGDVAAYQPFYVFNGLAVEGNLSTLVALAQRDDVARIVANYPLVVHENSAAPSAAPPQDLGDLHPDNWNMDLVDAERVWDAFGLTGQGAVVANVDTGVDYAHPALVNQYRGNLGGDDFVHDYNWFDPDPELYPGGDLGPSRTIAPFDYDGHGTHTMGTMVGDGGDPGTQVGMAPGAQWIAVSLNGMSAAGSLADDIMGHKAFQWMLCPTDLTGALASADCSQAPDAVNNSWGSANPADDTFRPDLQALRAAGVAPVFSSGNPSAGPGSIGSPGSNPEAITVGATDAADLVASFSGRGPSFYEGEQKPELSAPGVGVKSSVPWGYDYYSGTSMAAPHVAGLVALMVSADLQDGARDLDVDELEHFMASTAADLGEPGPDDDYGYGRIDAYDAVRWAFSAGDLRGMVYDATSGAPIVGAAVSGVETRHGDTFGGQTGAGGQYAVTVPAGDYDLSVGAWGYYGDAFAHQLVITGALSIADFALDARPAFTLSGQVRSGFTPISGALVYVAAQPSVNFVTGSDGAYALALPAGAHEIVVQAPGYRILREQVNVSPGVSTYDPSLTAAPTILLVHADVYAGWFLGWPVHNYFRWALDERDYLYDVWPIQDLDFNDTQVMPDGSTRYGIPSATTLDAYDLVLWAHGGDSYGLVYAGADDELMAYLDHGGRLIISAQDLAWSGGHSVFHTAYLHADYVMNTAAGEGETVSGQDFLAGLDLEITNASLHGYPNGATSLSPDAVKPRDGAALAALTYDNGNGTAALAIAPCDAPYRAVYFALGYENIAPRAGNYDPAISDVLDRSIAWVMAPPLAHDVNLSLTPSRQTSEPGQTVTYDLQIVNKGDTTATFELTLGGHVWTTRILSGTSEVTLTQSLPPCGVQDLSLEVDVPAAAHAGERDTATITAQLYPDSATPLPHNQASATTTAFPWWQEETPMPTPRHRLGAAALPNAVHYYAIGGWQEGTPMDANERYNACTGQWEEMAPMPQALANVGVAALEGKIYVVGGMDAAYNFYATVQAYDPSADDWSLVADLPEALNGVAVAAANGKLYAFGGVGSTDVFEDKTFEYDPLTDTWTERAPMPGGGRAYAAAAELDGKIYVAGGWPYVRSVEVYDPATDTWSGAAWLNVGRQSPGMVAAPDGYLYVSGGGHYWDGLADAEHYDPASATWEIIPSLNSPVRAGSASAFAAGRIFAVGGTSRYEYSSGVNESLRLNDTFCLSHKQAQQDVVRPGDRITYTVRLSPDAIPLADASLVDPLPAGTTFAGFGANPIGATYDSGAGQVRWHGDVPVATQALTFTFGVDVSAQGWANGEAITNTITFDSGNGLVFSHTAVTALDYPNASFSVKDVNKDQALAGETLTYTLHVQNSSNISAAFSLRDSLPAHTTYVPGSLTSTLGYARYDPLDDAITWAETLPYPGGYVNTSDDYVWGDSDGNGAPLGVEFDWIDIRDTGINVGASDDAYYCDLPIGFTFDFYGRDESAFCADTNGLLSFNAWGYSDFSNDCPLPNTYSNNAFVAAMWDDLVVEGGIYYETFGTAPYRYLVVQWSDVRHYGGSSSLFDFEIVLYESGAIRVQILGAGPEKGGGSTTGLEDHSETRGLTYACYTEDSLHDELAVVFVPPGGASSAASADITFAVTTDTPLPANTLVTNTATIATPYGAVTRSVSTLVNPVSLADSYMQADKTQVRTGDVVVYDLALRNVGLMPAIGATLDDPLPATTAYVPGSLACGSCFCDYAGGVVNWSGDVPPGAQITLTFAVTLTASLPDRTPVTNTALLNDGLGNVHELQAVFEARRSDMSASFKRATPAQVAPGDAVTYTVYLRNSGAATTAGEMRDELPPELNFVPGSLVCGSGSCGQASGTITWTGTLAPGYMLPVRFQALVSESATHNRSITNTAIVTDLDWMTGYPLAAEVTVDKLADLWVSKRGTWVEDDGATQVYTLAYGNAGPYDADSAAQVVDVLPPNATYLDAMPPGVYSPTLGTLTWDVGALPAGVSDTLSLRVRAPGGTLALTVLTNTASITPLPQDPDVDNNTARFVARNPDLGVSFKQASLSQVTPGGLVTYTITLHNAGLRAAMGEMRDALPPELSFVPGSLTCASGTASTGSCGYASGTITWTGSVGPQASVPVQFLATAPPGAAHGLLITNTALVTDLAWGLVYPLTALVEVVKPADLWVDKRGSKTAEAGEALVYTLTYGNAGPFDADSAAQVVDVLPAGVTYLDSAPPGVYDPVQGTVAWGVGALPASPSGTLDVAGTPFDQAHGMLTLSVTVPADTPSLTVLTNTARISPIPQDPNAANNADQLPTIVNLFDLAKAVNPPEALPGEAVTYTLTLANGDDVTVTARLTDPIPLGVAYVPGSSAINAVSIELYDDASGSIRWQGDVPPHSTTTLRFQAQITAARGTAITNTMQVKHREGIVSRRQVVVYATPYRAYLPLVVKGED